LLIKQKMALNKTTAATSSISAGTHNLIMMTLALETLNILLIIINIGLA